jgi:hypothetical protein
MGKKVNKTHKNQRITNTIRNVVNEVGGIDQLEGAIVAKLGNTVLKRLASFVAKKNAPTAYLTNISSALNDALTVELKRRESLKK